MQPAGVRQSNQRAVLTVVARAPGLSNADVARRTGLAPQTVSSVLRDLEAAGLLRRGELRRSGARGQPATPYYVAPDGAFVIGAAIGSSHFEVALVDLETRVVARERHPCAAADGASILPLLVAGVTRMRALIPASRRTRLLGLGLALPAEQRALADGDDLVAAVGAATGLDILVVENGHAACWAEYVAQPSPRSGSFAYLLLDTVLAAGIMSEDRLWEGPSGASANLGAMLVSDREGEAYLARDIASLRTLSARLDGVGASLDEAFAPNPPAAVAALLEGWIADAAFALARTVCNAAAVLEFDRAIIDGELPAALLGRLLAATERNIAELAGPRPHPMLVRGQLGRSGAAQGAAFLSMYRRLFSRELADMAD